MLKESIFVAISKKKREKVLKLIRNFEEKGEEDT